MTHLADPLLMIPLHHPHGLDLDHLLLGYDPVVALHSLVSLPQLAQAHHLPLPLLLVLLLLLLRDSGATPAVMRTIRNGRRLVLAANALAVHRLDVVFVGVARRLCRVVFIVVLVVFRLEGVHVDEVVVLLALARLWVIPDISRYSLCCQLGKKEL
jgi:hypothetical protein